MNINEKIDIVIIDHFKNNEFTFFVFGTSFMQGTILGFNTSCSSFIQKSTFIAF